MTIDPKNMVTITGGITADPDRSRDNMVKFSLAVDRAGSDKGGNATGYFDVVVWLTQYSDVRMCDFVRKNLEEGKLKKGSQISVVGRLVQERWTSDAGNRSKVTITAESVNWAGSGERSATTTNTDTGEANEAQAANRVPETF